MANTSGGGAVKKVYGNFIPGYTGGPYPQDKVALNPELQQALGAYAGSPGPGYNLHENITPTPNASVIPGVVGGAVAGTNAPKSPQDILAELMGQTYPGGTDNTDYFAQAQQIYDPQTDYLEGLEAKAKAQAASSGKSIAEVYAELARSIGAQAGGITKSYDTATSQGNAAYNTAYGNTKASFDDSRNGVADTLARLGIQEAAPNTTRQQSDLQGLMQSIIGANGMAQNNAMVQGKQSALDYNRAMQSGSKIRGGDAQLNLTSQLNGFLNELGLKKADLQSQIQQWAMEAQGKAQSSAYDQWSDQRDFDQRAALAGADLKYKYDALDAKNAPGAGKPIDPTKLDPVGDIGMMAQKMYGNPQAATNAVKAVMDTIAYANQGQTDSLQSFLAYLEERNQHNGQVAGDIGNLRALGTEYYRRMYK